MLKKMGQFFNLVGLMEMWFSAILLLSITGMILLQVFCRYILGSPLIWPEELATIVSIWMTFIGASYVYKKNRHLMLTYLVEKLPKPVRTIIDILINLAVIVFFYYVIKGGLKIIPIQRRNLTPALRIPTNFYTIPVLITSVLISVFIFYYILNNIHQKFTPKEK